MRKDEKRRMCQGCTDNFYNGNNSLGVSECWSLKSARPVTRYRIGTWTRPTEPGAFTKVRVLHCRREKGAALYESLPSCVTSEERKRVEGRKA